MTNDLDDFPTVVHFSKVAQEVESEKGPNALFALFEHDDNPGRWDLVVAADWITRTDRSTINYFIDKIRRYVPQPSPMNLSGVIVLKPTDHFVQAVLHSLPPQSQRQGIVHKAFSSLGLSDAYIITAAP